MTYDFQNALLKEVKKVYDALMLSDSVDYLIKDDDDKRVAAHWNATIEALTKLVESFGNANDLE